ncbi:MAG TPA: hypothetical protein VJL35_13330, partial [Gemmatimonadaceae bacterium]|nr:hypothetical protein [Gemmatimonadaceae bacterium]
YYPLKGNADSVRRIYAQPINQNWFRAGWFNGAYAYILDPLAAQYVADLQSAIWLEADTALSYLCRFSNLSAIAMKQPVFHVREELTSLIGARSSWV